MRVREHNLDSPLVQRLKFLQGDRKVSEFSSFLGIGNSTLWNYLGGRVPPADFLVLVIKKCKVDGHWLLTGEGDPFL